MLQTTLPPADEMLRAFETRDGTYEGVFLTAVRTTGIFCRPACPARKPKRENVEFFASVREALAAGYRPCRRCRPLEPEGERPEWLRPLLDAVERDPARRWTDADLRARGLEPSRVRRWFKHHDGLTFHGYVRARRLGRALGRIRQGSDLTDAGYDHGYESVSGFREAFARLFRITPGDGRATSLVVCTRLLTPLGPMVAGASDAGICLLEFADRPMLETQVRRLQKRLDCAVAPGDHEHLGQLNQELQEYFAGTRREFNVPLVLAGTEFQEAVWQALRRVPFGRTWSYERLARRIGRAGAQRAVGRANGDNRLAILVPCHRIVGRDGRLTGYGGGLWRKRALLDHEQAGVRGNGTGSRYDRAPIA